MDSVVEIDKSRISPEHALMEMDLKINRRRRDMEGYKEKKTNRANCVREVGGGAEGGINHRFN